MLRLHHAPLPAMALLLLAPLADGTAAAADAPRVAGPTQILYAHADTVFYLRSVEWWSAAVSHREKLLLHGLRMRYWRDHLPADMRLVFDALGYPPARTIHTPIGHTEEWWTYRLLDPPLRFRDGMLLDRDLFERYRSGR